MTSIERFFDAIRGGDAELVEAMAAAAPELLESRDERGLSPILAAVYQGTSEVVLVLRVRVPELDIHEAAALGEADRIRELVAEAPERARESGPDGSPPLHLACYFGHAAAVEALLDLGGDVHAWSGNAFRNQPLHAALAGPRGGEIALLLLDLGADPDSTAAGGYTPLHLAASRGDLALIDELLDRGARSRPAEDGRTPADVAAERGWAAAAARLSVEANPTASREEA